MLRLWADREVVPDNLSVSGSNAIGACCGVDRLMLNWVYWNRARAELRRNGDSSITIEFYSVTGEKTEVEQELTG